MALCVVAKFPLFRRLSMASRFSISGENSSSAEITLKELPYLLVNVDVALVCFFHSSVRKVPGVVGSSFDT